MATIVAEIMNAELCRFSPFAPIEQAKSTLLHYGITAAPVVDATDQLLGIVSLRDVVRAGEGDTVASRMTETVVTVPVTETIVEAGHLLSKANLHHLVVIDDQRCPVGFLSSLDICRGLLGLPAGHPEAFPHFDPETALVWTDATEMAIEQVSTVSRRPGLLALIRGGVSMPEILVWAESSSDLRARLLQIIRRPQGVEGALARLVQGGDLRFRAAETADPFQMRHALKLLRQQIGKRQRAGESRSLLQTTAWH